MATITVRVETKAEAELDKMYFIRDDDFTTVKDAVKATGARFDGRKREWVSRDAEAIEALLFEVTRADFYVSTYNRVIFRAFGDEVWSPPHLTEDGFPADARDYEDEAQRICDALQAAFVESTGALRAKMVELGLA